MFGRRAKLPAPWIYDKGRTSPNGESLENQLRNAPDWMRNSDFWFAASAGAANIRTLLAEIDRLKGQKTQKGGQE